MKKILLATTVLVGTAGFASAEVTLSGNGRMGIVYNETAVAGDNETSFNSRVRADVNMSASTDGGLEFGGSFGIHDAGAAASGTEGKVYISGAFGKLTMGSTDSAAQNAVGQLAGVGYTGLGDTNELGFNYDKLVVPGVAGDFTFGGYLTSFDKEIALYEYSASGFTGYVSIGQIGDSGKDVSAVARDLLDTYAVGAQYKTDTFTVGLGYENLSGIPGVDVTQISASASATFSGVTTKVIYANVDGGAGSNLETYGVSASYSMDALTVTGFLRQGDNAQDVNDTMVFTGIGASYSLGGGATLAGGVVNADGLTKADLGVNFKF